MLHQHRKCNCTIVLLDPELPKPYTPKPEPLCQAVEQLVERLRSRREEIVAALQWEICKNDGDAAKESPFSNPSSFGFTRFRV